MNLELWTKNEGLRAKNEGLFAVSRERRGHQVNSRDVTPVASKKVETSLLWRLNGFLDFWLWRPNGQWSTVNGFKKKRRIKFYEL